MQIIRSVREMQAAVRALRRSSLHTLGLVPTMGALHDGHISLVRAAKRECDRVCTTIFVNPLQFAPGEDLDRYPRTFAEDCALLEREGVDWLFAPEPAEMYPGGAGRTAATVVDVPSIGARLDGLARPGHFRGVATVVAKLFHIIAADKAFFGQKDAAQVAVLRRMVRDLNIDIDLVVCPTVRETDGLALSSRNRYLGPADRTRALALSRALRRAAAAAARGERHAAVLRRIMLHALESEEGVRVEYAAVVNPDTLEDVDDVRQGALLAVAARIGDTRLIDNIPLGTQVDSTFADFVPQPPAQFEALR